MKKKGTVLVVDDTLATLKMMVEILSAEGYTVRPANSGSIALSAINLKAPDLILLDVRMPELSGFDVCRQLKANGQTRDIPVIFLSAEVDQSERIEGFEIGAVDFISKPFNRGELLARIGTHLELWYLRRHLKDEVKQQTQELAQRNQELFLVSERLQLATKAANIGIWDWDIIENKLSWDERMYILNGVDKVDFAGTYDAWVRVLHPDDRVLTESEIQAALHGVRKYAPEFRVVHPDGTIKFIKVDSQTLFNKEGKAIRMIGTNIDITEKKNNEIQIEQYKNHLESLVIERTEELATSIEELKATNDELYIQKDNLEIALNKLNEAQQQLIHAEKMASLGVLSAGIAHEINNPLNFIQGGIFGIEEYFRNNSLEHFGNLTQLINAVNVGVKRATEIVSSLNHYSRGDDLPIIECDIHTIIDNCLIMLQNQFKNNVIITKNFTKNKCLVLGREGKLHQAFLNIIANSVQAIKDQGFIEISTEALQKSIVISIVDSGIGISKENLSKIFDPFYTTKETGKGIGLGLSITYNIIQELYGTLVYESEPSIGTKVIITLPIN